MELDRRRAGHDLQLLIAMKSIDDRVAAITPGVGEPPWPGYEYVRGWGVFGLPFDSGHVLALRVFPQNSFGPYVTVWHRDPSGSWTIFVDNPHVEAACPRYYGQACDRVEEADIALNWQDGTLTVTSTSAQLNWTVTPQVTAFLRAMNAVAPRMPLWTWRTKSLRRARELVAKRLGMGELEMAGVMPSGHYGILMPERMYLIDESSATLDGVDLGKPTKVAHNPTIGGVALPARGIMAIGQAAWEIRDQAEFDSLRATPLS
ncbi:MAG: hypothetical protein LLG14_04220 [Nocardiaceae bacterium]|nr:hypothetical protein [Nocardiaceae bacterium]